MLKIKYFKYLIITFIFYSCIYAGNTGKISGKVTDKETGAPLMGANVVITEHSMGMATDEDGFYFIIGVPLGEMTITCSYIGYHKITINKVFVQVDLTTEINIELEPESVELPEISVTAEKRRIQKDVTSTRRITTSGEIQKLPGLESATDVLNIRAGVVIDDQPMRLNMGDGTQLQVRDESLKNVHIRGGRGGEILYMVDGMPVNHPIYGGRAVLDINVEEVEQVELLTGAFNAEYGQAQSGVVNITTKSGTQNLTVGVENKSDFTPDDVGVGHNTQYSSFYMGGPLFSHKRLGSIFYFLSGNMSLSDSYTPNGRKRGKFEVFPGYAVDESQNNTRNLNAKITWALNSQNKIVFSHHNAANTWTNYDWNFLFYPDNSAQYERYTQTTNIRFNKVFSKKTYMNINLGQMTVDYNASLDGESDPASFWKVAQDTSGNDYIYTTAKPPQIDQASMFYNDVGVQALWRDDYTTTNTIKGMIASQVTNNHLVNMGASIQFHDIQYIDIVDGAYKLSNYGMYIHQDGDTVDAPPGPYPEFGQTRWVFFNKPSIGEFYIQDKFELETLIINYGVRLDWINLGDELNADNYKKKWGDATGLETNWDLLKTNISPRFGISFPVAEYTTFFFSYGHFNQLPELQFYYRDPWSGGFTGNPHMGYINSVLYEYGFSHRLYKEWYIDIKSYGKDISEQVGTEFLQAAAGLPVQLYVNNGYGRARGLELEINKNYNNYTSLDFGYTLQYANGYSSSAFSDFVRTQFNLPKPIRERPLDWDVRHQIIVNATIAVPDGENPQLFGFLKIPDDWSLTMLTRYSSGKPYTPGTLDPLEARVRENGEPMPYIISSDLRFNKSLTIMKKYKFSVFCDIYSVFNRRNANNVNTWTGVPPAYGDIAQPTDELYSWRRMNHILNPGWWTPPRYMKLGIRFNI